MATHRNVVERETGEQMKPPSIIVFDVNQTLIDMESLAPLFERLFGDGKTLREWFNQLILYSNAMTLTGYYETFFALGRGVLEMLGSIYDSPITKADLEELTARLLLMPAHSDVPEGLEMLREAGFRLVTLTNSPPDKDGSAVERAGLADFFERQFSVDSVRRFKPAAEVYQLVVKSLEREPPDLCLVAAHPWDTLGAQSVGFAAGLLMRPGNAPLPMKGCHNPK